MAKIRFKAHICTCATDKAPDRAIDKLYHHSFLQMDFRNREREKERERGPTLDLADLERVPTCK